MRDVLAAEEHPGGGAARGQRRSDPQRPSRKNVTLVGTYPPTACGLATFTANLRQAIAAPGSSWSATVVRILDEPEPTTEPEIVATWQNGRPASMRGAMETLEGADAVLLQHEFGLFGGADGEDVLQLVRRLEAPLITVLHTLLVEPNPNQRAIIDELLEWSAEVVVLTETARDRLATVHGIDRSLVTVIPHGAEANFTGPAPTMAPRPSFLTWGLIGPGKGIEHGIEALARLVDREPPATYLVVGQTHPKVREREGERYRHQLMDLAERLGVADRVVFDDSYRDWRSLRSLVRSADAVLLPYDSRDQVTSGVLVEALASAKPIISTRFPHAREALAGGAGIVVAHGDAEAMSVALGAALYDPAVATAMIRAARQAAQPLLWPVVGTAFRSLLDRVASRRVVA